jgi:hypothetical protein
MHAEATGWTMTRGLTFICIRPSNHMVRATQHNTTQHNTTQHNTTQHNTTQHNTTHPFFSVLSEYDDASIGLTVLSEATAAVH